MARLWSCGFELQSVTAGIEFDTSTGTGAKAISTAVKRGGAASLRVNPTTDYWFMSHQFRASSTTKVYLRFALLIGTLPGSDISIVGLSDTATGNTIAQMKLTTTGTLQLGFYNGSFNNVGSPSTALTTNLWYLIEISADDSVANNTITARLEGVEFANGNGNNLGNTSFLQLGSIFSTATYDLNFDDIAINDGAGSFQTSFPGNGKIVHLNTTGAGDNTSWAASAGNAWDCIDEVPPSDADYVQTSTVNAISDYTVGAITEDANIVVNVVSVGTRQANDTASGTSAFQTRIKKVTAGTVSASGDIIPNTTSYQTHVTAAPHVYQLTTYQDPDSAAWTKATLNTMQIGVKETVDSVRNLRVSKLWAMVDYTPALVSTLSDSYDDNSLDTTNKWTAYTALSGTISETNKRTEIQLAASTNGSWGGNNSKYQYTLVGSSAYINFALAASGHSWLDLTLSNEALGTPNNFISIGIDIGTQKLQAVKEVNGVDSTLNEITYDPTVHKWGRIRESSGTVYWEWSTDGLATSTWSELYSTSTIPVPITSIYVITDDYEYDGTTTPSLHILDSFNTPGPIPVAKSLSVRQAVNRLSTY
jgi:hypothetical protein